MVKNRKCSYQHFLYLMLFFGDWDWLRKKYQYLPIETPSCCLTVLGCCNWWVSYLSGVLIVVEGARDVLMCILDSSISTSLIEEW